MPKHAVHVKNGPQPGGAYSPVQTARTLENIKLLLAAAGAEMSDVVKATVHLSDMALFDRYNVVYASYFPDPKPVRTTVGSQLDGFMVEIDVIAYLGA